MVQNIAEKFIPETRVQQRHRWQTDRPQTDRRICDDI